jgi:hypothetical protein
MLPAGANAEEMMPGTCHASGEDDGARRLCVRQVADRLPLGAPAVKTVVLWLPEGLAAVGAATATPARTLARALADTTGITRILAIERGITKLFLSGMYALVHGALARACRATIGCTAARSVRVIALGVP